MASIRELVPRVYVEVAIIKCYRLLHPASDLKPIIARLQQMVSIAPADCHLLPHAWHNLWSDEMFVGRG